MNNLSKIRLACNVTQKEIAETLNCSDRLISKFEKSTVLQNKTLEKLATFFKTSKNRFTDDDINEYIEAFNLLGYVVAPLLNDKDLKYYSNWIDRDFDNKRNIATAIYSTVESAGMLENKRAACINKMTENTFDYQKPTLAFYNRLIVEIIRRENNKAGCEH